MTLAADSNGLGGITLTVADFSSTPGTVEISLKTLWLGEIWRWNEVRDSDRIAVLLERVRMPALDELPEPFEQRKAIGKRIRRARKRSSVPELRLIEACYWTMWYGAEPGDVAQALTRRSAMDTLASEMIADIE